MPSQVLSFRLSPDNPHERTALEYFERESEAGRSTREIIADALVLAAQKERDTRKLASTTQALARQQEQMLQMLERMQKNGVAVAGQGDNDDQGTSSAPVSEGMKKLLGKQRRPLRRASGD